jgi:predicted TIM-barrel fold metal-dependent hydrolase
MGRIAIISIDGHVKASRAQYRDYIEKKYLEVYDEQVKAAEEAGLRDAGNLHMDFDPAVQWDSDLRMKNLESKGVVAEVLFPNGRPFQVNRLDDFASSQNVEQAEEGRRAYNRWLVDFCSLAPERRRGQMQISLEDVDRAVEDVYWAKEHGLGGIGLPAPPAGTFFFDPRFDPVWAAAQEVGLVISQHGGAGLPGYSPPGFAAILTIMTENAFFSSRSLWQLIAGGVFDRFPNLRMAYIETQLMFLIPAIANLDMILGADNDVMGFARMMNRDRSVQRLASEYFQTNIFVGVSPFSPRQIPTHVASGMDAMGELLGITGEQRSLPGFHIGVDACMFGVDYPHFESIFERVPEEVADLVGAPGVTEDDVHKVLFENAAEVYGFDLGALQPDIDRVGFETGDLLVTASA